MFIWINCLHGLNYLIQLCKTLCIYLIFSSLYFILFTFVKHYNFDKPKEKNTRTAFLGTSLANDST